MLFVYGTKKDAPSEYTLEVAISETKTFTYGFRVKRTRTTKSWTLNKAIEAPATTGESFLQDLYDAGLEYTSESDIDISIGDRNAYISDGVNPIHKITITNRGELVASYAGLKAPKNKPRISLEELNEQYDYIVLYFFYYRLEQH